MQVANVEDVYRLSPLQQGMLSHILQNPAAGGEVAQLCVVLAGPLSPAVLKDAWERVTASHPALRTAFRWEKLRAPFQVVHRKVEPAFEERGGEIARFLAEDRARRLDLAKPPLVRLSVLRTGPEEHVLVWTSHPMVLDRDSVALAAGEVLALAESLARGESPEPARAPSFRTYVDWLHQQGAAAAESFWRRELVGIAPTPIPSDGQGFGSRTVHLSPEATAALRSLGIGHGLFLETLIHGVWALLLAGEGGGNDVLFGIEVPGRPAALPGTEETVGLFRHTLPLRVAVDPEAPVLAWLKQVQERQAAFRPFEHSTLSEVQGWSGMAPGTPLFHSRVVVESFPSSLERRAGEIRWIAPLRDPLTLAVRPGAELELEIVFDRSSFSEARAAALQDRLRALLESFAAEPGRRVGDPVPEPAETASPASSTSRSRLFQSRGSAQESDREAPRPVRSGGAGGAGRSDVVPVSRDQPLPASFYQEWALQLDGVRQNSLQSALRIEGPFDLKALRWSLAEIARRHEPLRTSFHWRGDEAYLTLAPPAEVPLPVIDLSALPGERREALQRPLLLEHAAHEFEMERGPLFVAQVLRLGPQAHVLCLNVHHLISDGWSIQVLHRELMILYAAFLQGRPSPLPPLPIQLTDFSYWQRRVYAGEALASHLAWWRRNLADLPPRPPLPIDLPRPEAVGSRAVAADLPLAPHLAQDLRRLAQEAQGSLSMVLLAAVNAHLHAYSGQEDLIVSLIFAARNRPELSGMIGFLMNTVPVRVGLAGNPSFRELVARMRDAMIEGYAHQDVPFPRLLTELFPGRKLTRTLLTGVCFNMLSFPEAAGPMAGAGGGTLPGGLRLRQIGSDEGLTKHDLAYTCSETGGAVSFNFLGAADLFLPEGIAEVARSFGALLARATADPDVRLDALRQLVRETDRRPYIVS